jgi:DNA polymerase III alpha subunit
MVHFIVGIPTTFQNELIPTIKVKVPSTPKQDCQSNWFMPDEYKTLDIEAWIWEQTPPWDPQHTRVTEELAAFKERNMMDLLRWLKYFVDTCNKNNVVWGVGRGSSVASYILYLIGVHHIDSIKYNLEWQEFLR